MVCFVKNHQHMITKLTQQTESSFLGQTDPKIQLDHKSLFFPAGTLTSDKVQNFDSGHS